MQVMRTTSLSYGLALTGWLLIVPSLTAFSKLSRFWCTTLSACAAFCATALAAFNPGAYCPRIASNVSGVMPFACSSGPAISAMTASCHGSAWAARVLIAAPTPPLVAFSSTGRL